MRRSLLNNLNLTKCLRQALVLFTLLLLPSAAWGQITVVDVGLLVSGTVTREGIITGTVTYDADNNILTLEDADITYEGSIIIAESSKKLTIDIIGNNTIKTTRSDPVITRTDDASPEIEFTSSTNTGSLILEYAGGDSNQRLLELITPSGLAPKFLAPGTANDWSSATKAEIKALGLTVAGVTATTGNCTDILTGDNKGKVSFTPAEGSDPATLTLAGVNIGPSSAGIVWSGFYPLKIKYSGNNIINTRTESVKNEEDGYCIFYNGSNTGSPALSLSASDDASTLVLKPSNGESNSRAAITRFSVNCNGWGMYYSDDCSQVTDATNPTPGKEVIISKEPPLGLSVAGVPITSANKDDVLKDGGKVKFTPADGTASPATPAILTLNGAVLTAPVIVGLPALTIDIQGTNSITTNVTCIQEQENMSSSPSLIFKSTSAEVGSLTLTNTSDNSDGVINDKYFEKFTISNELALIMLRYGGYTSNTYYFTAGEVHNAQIVPSYGVQVESAQILQVYEGNANDILGDGTDTKEPTVSFDKTTNTLTLNGASGISNISTTLSSLNIELVGSNSLNRSSDGSIFDSSSGEAVTINLKSTGETKGTLTIETGSNSSAKFKGDNVTLTPVAPIVLLSGDLTTNSGTLEYGTLSAPTMSSETVDGVSTITLTSTADNSTIKYSIDYVDASQTDITDATYDSSSKPTVSKPATVTAKVTLNEVESATTTGKYFGTNPSPFTLISGTDPIDFDLAPAIVESDGISITSISGIESNVTYDAATRKISSSTMGSFNGQVSMSSTEGKTVILNNNFTATFTVQIDISDAVVTLDYDELTYNGKEQSVNVTKVMAGDIEVAADYYEVSDNSGTEVGNYKLTVTAKLKNSDGSDFKNNFTGTATAEFKIVYRKVTSEELGFSDSDSQPSGTYYSETEDLGVPDGMVAYIITGINGNSVTTQRVSYIPKGVAVLVEKSQSSESANDIIPYPSTLPLKGTLEPVDVTSITGGTVYVLYNGEFVKSTSGTIPAHRCYLLVATNVASGTRSFSIDHGDGTTALREVKSEEAKGEKWADGAWHDLQGRHLPAKPTNPGLYLHNGNKVVIK